MDAGSNPVSCTKHSTFTRTSTIYWAVQGEGPPLLLLQEEQTLSQEYASSRLETVCVSYTQTGSTPGGPTN